MEIPSPPPELLKKNRGTIKTIPRGGGLLGESGATVPSEGG